MQSGWFKRIRQVMEWSAVARACLPPVFLLALYGAYYVWAEAMLRIPGGTAVLNTAVYARFLPMISGLLAGAAVLLVFGLLLRRRHPESVWFQHVTAQYYGLSLVLGGYITGTLNIATGAVLMGAPILGFLLLERYAVLLALVVSFATILVLNIASAWGDLPYAPLLLAPTDTRSALLWTTSQLFLVAPFLASALTQVATVVSYWREREARVLELSLTDMLTGVPNRRCILDTLERELSRAQRLQQPLAVVLLDLDHFKRINDRWGHPTGDRVLQGSATALAGCIRPGDAIGRFGGEEFLLVLPDATPEQATQVVERCRQALYALEVRADRGEAVPVRSSFGLAWVEPGDRTEAKTLVRAADEALYGAKAAGRDQLVVAPAACRGRGAARLPASGRLGLRNLTDLRRALSRLQEWTPVAKAGLFLGYLLLLTVNYWAYLGYVLARPDRATHIDTNVAEALLQLIPPVLGLTLLLIGLSIVLRRSQPASRPFQYLALTYFATILIPVGYTLGMLYMPTGAVLLCSALLGFILFERRIVLTVFGPALVAVIALAYASALGALPYAPILAARDTAWQMTSPFWVLTNYFFICWVVPVVVVLTDRVLGRWRVREAEVQALSQTDALTGVGNRRNILDELGRELRQAGRSGAPVAVVLLDLDHFKRINDTWGHPTGDRVLQDAAKVLRETLRQSDAIGRYGGEEFMLLLRDTSREGALALLERCRTGLEEMDVRAETGERVPVSASFGMACINVRDDRVADALIRAADEALYRAKASGRNRIEAADTGAPSAG